jgi:hypothetical protein
MSQQQRKNSQSQDYPPEDNHKKVEQYQVQQQRLKKTGDDMIASQSPFVLREEVLQTDDIFRHGSSSTKTLTYDLENLGMITHMAVNQAVLVNLLPKSLNIQNIRSRLNNRFGTEEGNFKWAEFGDWALRRSRVVAPCTEFLYGLEQFHPKERVRTQRRPRDKDVVPDAKKVGEKQLNRNPDEGLLERAIELCKKLESNGDLPLGTAICSQSFNDTVQNAFDLSLLVHEGKVGLKLVNGRVMATARVDRKVEHRRQQCVLHLNFDEHKELVSQSGDFND